MPTWLLQLVRCPITLENLDLAPAELVERLRGAVRDGKLTNRLGVAVSDDFQMGLVNASGTWFYPVADDIPTLVPDEAITV